MLIGDGSKLVQIVDALRILQEPTYLLVGPGYLAQPAHLLNVLDVGFLQRWTEVGRQNGLNFRQSGFFNGVSSTITIDPRNPTSYVPVAFRNVASDVTTPTS